MILSFMKLGEYFWDPCFSKAHYLVFKRRKNQKFKLPHQRKVTLCQIWWLNLDFFLFFVCWDSISCTLVGRKNPETYIYHIKWFIHMKFSSNILRCSKCFKKPKLLTFWILLNPCHLDTLVYKRIPRLPFFSWLRNSISINVQGAPYVLGQEILPAIQQ